MEVVPGSVSTIHVAPASVNTRLDRYLQEQLPHLSRSFLQKLISSAAVTVNDLVTTKAHKIIGPGSTITIAWPNQKIFEPSEKDVISLDVKIIAQTTDFLIIDKPAGLTVHQPTKASTEVTLVDWLLTYYHELKEVGDMSRPGIVHRLDKDTSGLMIIARTQEAHRLLSALFKERKIKKTYTAIVHGHPEKKGCIDFRIARHPTENRMTHIAPHGRDALTHYEIIEYFNNYCYLKAFPLTGRTHQIRVHFAGIDHPLVGDNLYGKKSDFIVRHCLHATALSFRYKGIDYTFESTLPADMQKVIEQLKDA